METDSAADHQVIEVGMTAPTCKDIVYAVQDYALPRNKVVCVAERSGLHRLIVFESEGY